MKKSDLKTGMIIETRAGALGLIMLNNSYGEDAVVFSKNNWTDLSGFNKDTLEWNLDDRGVEGDSVWEHCVSVDIVKVHKPDLPTGFLSRKNKFSENLTLLWERKEVVEYTMDELVEKIGHNFKIKK